MPKKWSAQEKLAVLQDMKRGHMGIREIAQKYGVGMTALKEWRKRYELHGYKGLEQRTHNRGYTVPLNLSSKR